MFRTGCRPSRTGTTSGNSATESSMTSDRRMSVELYSGWWISWEMACSNCSGRGFF